jgi:hypothetical protein
MGSVQVYDRVKITDVRQSPTGGLRIRAAFSRTGVQDYGAFKAFRSESEVFDAASLSSMRDAPATVGHPNDFVTPQNWRQFAVGHIADVSTSPLAQDGEKFVSGELVIDDGEVVEAILAEKAQGREIECSLGYSLDYKDTPGTHNGVAYDKVQTNIRVNHLALLGQGQARAGGGARLFDSQGKPPMQKITIDGVEYDVGSPSHVQVLQKQAKDAADTLKVSEAELAKQTARADTAEAALKKIDVGALVADELAFRERASRVLGPDYKFGVATRRAVMNAALDKLGAKVAADRSDDYVSTYFDARLDAVGEDYNLKPTTSAADDKNPAEGLDLRAQKIAAAVKKEGWV